MLPSHTLIRYVDELCGDLNKLVAWRAQLLDRYLTECRVVCRHGVTSSMVLLCRTMMRN
jgi:hypothetical protein